MPISFQDINELLARGGLPQGELKLERDKAERYLKSCSGDKPDWLEGFFDSNRNKLNETILRAIASSEGISSLRGYTEGYFNEIIQNANDLHAGECIDISVRNEGSVYSVECRYKDKGFDLSNIYGFLNREMSDKSSEEGQTGKFGIGIKSFFKFVKKLRVESNVVFDFSLSRADKGVNSSVTMNCHWDKKHTVLYFEFDENDEGDFNTKKFCRLIDFLNGSIVDSEVVRRSFISGEDYEIIFDIHSMAFMNKSSKRINISQLNFVGQEHKLSISSKDVYGAQKIEIDSNKWVIR